MDRVRVCILNPTRTFEWETGVLVDRELRTEKTNMTIFVNPSVIIPQQTPIKVDSIGQITDALLRSARPTFSNGKRTVLVARNDPEPLQWNVQHENERVALEGQIMDQMAIQMMAEQETATILRDIHRTQIVWMVAFAGILMSLLVIAVITLRML